MTQDDTENQEAKQQENVADTQESQQETVKADEVKSEPAKAVPFDLSQELSKTDQKRSGNSGLTRLKNQNAELKSQVSSMGDSINEIKQMISGLGNQQSPSLDGVDAPDGKSLEARFQASEQQTKRFIEQQVGELRKSLESNASNQTQQATMTHEDLKGFVSESYPSLKGYEDQIIEALVPRIQQIKEEGHSYDVFERLAMAELNAVAAQSMAILSKSSSGQGVEKVSDSEKTATASTKIIEDGATTAKRSGQKTSQDSYFSVSDAIASIEKDKLCSGLGQFD